MGALIEIHIVGEKGSEKITFTESDDDKLVLTPDYIVVSRTTHFANADKVQRDTLYSWRRVLKINRIESTSAATNGLVIPHPMPKAGL